MTAKLPDIDCKLPGVPHRGPATHSLLAALIVTVLAGTCVMFAVPGNPIIPFVMAGVACGVVLHILADALTISGVPIFWPVIRRDVHLLPRGFRVRTGGRVEPLVSVLVMMMLAGFLYGTYLA